MFNWLKKTTPSIPAAPSVAIGTAANSSAIQDGLAENNANHKSLGDQFFEEGKLKEAAESYQRAIDINPDFAEAYNNLGNVYREQGLSGEAERCLKQAILIKPELVNAYCNLGSLLLKKKMFAEAIENFNKALKIKPDVANLYLDLALDLVQAGQIEAAKQIIIKGLALYPDFAELLSFLGNLHWHKNELDQAVACYQRALSLQPDYPEVLSNLAKVFLAQGNLNEAVNSYRTLLSLKPDNAEIYYALGELLYKQGKKDEAKINFLNALSFKPDFAEAHIYIGNILNELVKPDEALQHYQNALSINPDLVEAHINKGNILKEQGKTDDAMTCYQNGLELKPDSPEIHLNLGLLFKSYGEFKLAITSYQKALELKPDSTDAFNNLGNVLFEQNLLNEALSCYRKAIAIKPDFADAYYSMGAVLIVQQKNDEGIEFLRKALDIDPAHNTARILMLHQLQHMCKWIDLESIIQTVRSAVLEAPTNGKNLFPPFAFLAIPGATAEEQKQCAERWAQSEYLPMFSFRKKLGFEFKRTPKNKIRIGYISADLRNHPVAFLMAEIFELHDRNRFEIIAYAYDTDKSCAMRKRLELSFDDFIDISDYSYEQSAKKIYEDQIDILIDLTGHTQNNRCGILALRPAPIQASYLGYPGTMGADFFDYLIADHFTIPLDMSQHYTEKVARLPECFQANDRTRPRPASPPRADCGLPNEAVVFCCFNQTLKITPQMFDIWCSLLTAVPGSILWIPASNPQAEGNLRSEAKARGITTNQIVMAPLLHREEHLARMQCADMFLDTLPYNAGTTCSDALWVGLPVITCAGDSFVSRMAGSLLTSIGVPELITYNLEDYYHLALDLATDSEKLKAIRNRIIASRDTTPLFDSARFTRNLENVYIQMMTDYSKKSTPFI